MSMSMLYWRVIVEWMLHSLEYCQSDKKVRKKNNYFNQFHYYLCCQLFWFVFIVLVYLWSTVRLLASMYSLLDN